MKNLILKLSKYALKANEMQKIIGGYGGYASCTANCYGGGTKNCNCDGGNCHANDGTQTIKGACYCGTWPNQYGEQTCT